MRGKERQCCRGKASARVWFKLYLLNGFVWVNLINQDFVGCNGGIVVKYEKMDKDDPNSAVRAVVKSACAID